MPLNLHISYVPQRWIVCALCSLAFAIIGSKNACYYAIADIVKSLTEQKVKPTGGCPFLFFGSAHEERTLPFFLPNVYWNRWILTIGNAAFSSGMLLTGVPAGMISDIGYSKVILSGGMGLLAGTHLLYPVSARFGVNLYALVNFFDGVGEASIFTSAISLISRWAPPSERNRFTAITVAGLYYGDTIGHVLFRLIYKGYCSWSTGQYATGTIGLVWLVLCFVFVYDSPGESPFVSQHEFDAIVRYDRRRSFLIGLHKLHGIPWWKILTSLPFLTLVLVYCSLDWCIMLNISGNLEFYQTHILHLHRSFGRSSMIVIFVGLPSMLMGGFLADWIIKHELISNSTLKRVFVFISVFSSSVLLVIACLSSGCNIVYFWILNIVAVYTEGLAVPVVYSAPIDLSPRHAGLLMGIMNGALIICSLLDIEIDNVLITDVLNPSQWHIRCLVCAAIALVMMIPFLFFGSGEKQLWRRQTRLQSLNDPSLRGETYSRAISIQSS